jgi:hypothetical protein
MSFTTVIKPKNRLFDVDFQEIWHYRDLFSMFVKRDIITQYKQTILGPTWFFIQPALTTVMYMIVFAGIAGISTDGLPEPMFYLAGIFTWQYFADCLNKTSTTFTTNQNIFGKVYFPRLILPPALDVRHPGLLPTQYHVGEVAVSDGSQSGDRHRGDFSLFNYGCRHLCEFISRLCNFIMPLCKFIMQLYTTPNFSSAFLTPSSSTLSVT